MDISFMGYAENMATFLADSELLKGNLVKMSEESGKVTKANNDGDLFCGKAINVRGGYASIQLSGYMTAKYSGTIQTGYQNVVIDENGLVKVHSNGNKILVITIDETNNEIGFIL